MMFQDVGSVVLSVCLFLCQHGLYPGDILLQPGKLGRIFQSPYAMLKPKLKKVFSNAQIFLDQIFDTQGSQFTGFHIDVLLLTMVVGNGSLKLASRKASIASSSGIPLIS